MYTIVSAVGLPKGSIGNWVNITPANSPVFRLYQEYDSVLLELVNIDSQESGWFNIVNIPIGNRTLGIKLSEYLAMLGNNTLVLVPDTPAERDPRNINYVRSLFANDFGFKQRLINRNFHMESDLAPDQKIDLFLTHPEIPDYKKITDNALFTVNGLVHRASPMDTGIMVYEGGRTMTKVNDNRVGLLDFKGVGGLTVLPFTDDMLISHPGMNAGNTAYFKMPVQLDNISVLLVMGGFLYFIDPVIDYIAIDRIKINFRFIDLIQQYYANYEIIERPEDFPLTPSALTPDRFVRAEFYTEEYIRATLHLSQSFFVLVNSPKLVVNAVPLDNCKTPGQYRTADTVNPDIPVRIGHGFFPEFNRSERATNYTLGVPHYMLKHPMRYTTLLQEPDLIRDQQYGYDASEYAPASQLLITDGGAL